MSFPSSDPYASPSGFVPKPGAEPQQMRYLEAFQYIFAHPEWTMSVLLAGVCALIPVINQIILAGYAYEIVESLHRYPGSLYPKFDFGRFSQYLIRGIWPFLVNLVLGFVIMLPMMCIMFIFMGAIMGMARAGDRDSAGAAAGLGMCCMYVVILLLIMGMQVVMMPFMLRAGLAQDFVEAFKFQWAMDFLGKMWMQTTGAVLFLFGASLFVFTPLILITCGIAAIPIAAIAVMAHAHLNWQLYQIYLARGGEPIPLKAWDGPPPG